MANALATPIVTVNDRNVAIQPNSFEYDDGFGERNLRTQSSGPDESETVVTENAETQFSMIKFTLLSTEENADLVRIWLDNFDQNEITAVQGSWTRSFRKAVVTNNPTVAVSQDGSFDIEFKSEKAA